MILKHFYILLLLFSYSVHTIAVWNPLSLIETNHFKDELSLTSFSFRKRMDLYLGRYLADQRTEISIHYLESLRNKTIDEYVQEQIKGDQEQGIYLILSLSDRQFKIVRSPDYVGPPVQSYINTLSDQLLPYIKNNRFEEASIFFSEQVINQLTPEYKMRPPPYTYKSFLNAKGLIFFLVIFILIFLFGRHLRTPHLIYTSKAKDNKMKRQNWGQWL